MMAERAVREPAATPDVPEPPATFAGLAALAEELRAFGLSAWLHNHVRVIDYRPGVLKFQLEGKSNAKHIGELSTFLKSTFGMVWDVEQTDGEAADTLHRQEERRHGEERQAVLDQPIIQDVLAAFPEAELIDYDPPNSKVA